MVIHEVHTEFDRQVQNLVNKGYPEQIVVYASSLKKQLDNQQLPDMNLEHGTLPFVIVISHTVMPIEEQMSLVDKDGKKGITKLFPHTSTDFTTIDKISIPDKKAYLILDIDRGKETRNIRPEDAFLMITDNHRSPLTIDEGVAIVTHYPDFLMKNNCFSLLASRHSSDQRVPAIWINAEKHPNLGWCWDRNPHTWLGSASCRKRM